MAGTTMDRAGFPDCLDPSFRKIFYKHWDDADFIYDKIFNILGSDRKSEKDSSISGLGKWTQSSEGGAVTYDESVQNYDVTYTHNVWKSGVQITREAYDDDQFNVLRKVPADLSISAKRTVETASADIFNNGFTTGGGGYATFTGGDAVSLCSASHPRADGGTAISNTTTMDLAEDSLETGLVAMRNTVDNKGELKPIMPDTLLLPVELEKEGMILMKSSGRVGSDVNDINPYKGRLKMIVWDYLSSTTAWFLLDSSGHQLNFFWRKRPEVSTDKAAETHIGKWIGYMRFSVGWSDWRGVYGSVGDNS